MRKVLFFALIMISVAASGQSTIPFASGGPNDTAVTPGSLRLGGVLRIPKLATTDTGMMLSPDAAGRMTIRKAPKTDTTSLSNRINAKQDALLFQAPLGVSGNTVVINLSGYTPIGDFRDTSAAHWTAISGKQPTLSSGNFKTINGQSIFPGPGNIVTGNTLLFKSPLKNNGDTISIDSNYNSLAPGYIQYPSWWTWRPFSGSVPDFASYLLPYYSPLTTYYVSNAGQNSFNGLTPATAFRTPVFAFAQQGVRKVEIVGSGLTWFDRTATIGDFLDSSSSPLAIINRTGFPVYFTSAENAANLTWTDSSGIYKTTRSATGSVIDTLIRDSLGRFTYYRKVNSIASCIDSAGTWFNATGSNVVYVHSVNNRAVTTTSGIFLLMNTSNVSYFHRGQNKFVYLEGITFIGGPEGAFVAKNDTPQYSGYSVYAKNCTFSYGLASGANGLTSYANYTYLQGCKAYYNARDGFNYHNRYPGKTPVISAFEIGCESDRNGIYDYNGNNNATTAHDTSVVIRIDGTYHHSSGPNLADVNNCKSLNIRCEAYGSTAPSSINNIDAYMEATSAMIDCNFHGSDYSLVLPTVSSTADLMNVSYDTKRSIITGKINQIIPNRQAPDKMKPTISSGLGAGSGTVTLDKDASNEAGVITVSAAGTPAANSTICTITLGGDPYYSKLVPIITPENNDANGLSGSGTVFAQRINLTSWRIVSGDIGLMPGTYRFSYCVIGNK